MNPDQNYEIQLIPTVTDPRGNLSFIQKGTVPFEIMGVGVNCEPREEGMAVGLTGQIDICSDGKRIRMKKFEGVEYRNNAVEISGEKGSIYLNIFSKAARNSKLCEKDGKWRKEIFDGSSPNPGFDVRRVYYLTDIPVMAERGGHSHFRQWVSIIALKGEFDVKLDDGFKMETIRLDKSCEGLLVGPSVWRRMSGFSEGSVALILSSTMYDPSDYVYDYELFKRMARRKKK